jgi:hypothetical protein
MKIDLRENGIHSLAEALKAFRVFHENPDAPNVAFALKDSILRAHHALETLFKKALMEYNSVLLLEKNEKVGDFVESYKKFLNGDIAWDLEELRTIALRETISRLNIFGFIKMDSREFSLFLDSVDKLDRYRNRLQHLLLSADPDVIARILGIVLPRAIDLLGNIPRHHPILSDIFFDEPIMKTLERDFPDVISTVQLLRSNYDCLVEQAVAFFKGKVFHDLKIELRINDHGTGFWGPPELKADGFINFLAEKFGRSPLKGEPLSRIEEYSAGTQISEPEFTGMNVFPFDGHLKGSLTFRGEIKFRKAEGLLALPDSEAKVPFIRDLTIIIDARLEYDANGMKGSGHFDIREIQ